MTKKDYILKLLEIISKDAFPIKDDIGLLLENNALSDELIDMISKMFIQAVKNTTDELTKQQLNKGILFLQALKKKEEISKQEDEKDLERLLSQI